MLGCNFTKMLNRCATWWQHLSLVTALKLFQTDDWWPLNFMSWSVSKPLLLQRSHYSIERDSKIWLHTDKIGFRVVEADALKVWDTSSHSALKDMPFCLNSWVWHIGRVKGPAATCLSYRSDTLSRHALSLLPRINPNATSSKQQAIRDMSLTETACISMWTVHTGTMVISLLKLSLRDRRYISKATFLLYRLSLSRVCL